MGMLNRDSIPLDKEKGVNPHVLLCERCGKDHSIGLFGTGGYKKKCDSCGMINVCNAGTNKCGSCDGFLGHGERLGDSEHVVTGLCDGCIEKQKECDEEVKKGGVYWKCPDCGSAGALKGSSELAIAARLQLGVVAPDLCGVEFNKDNCPVCTNAPE